MEETETVNKRELRRIVYDVYVMSREDTAL